MARAINNLVRLSPFRFALLISFALTITAAAQPMARPLAVKVLPPSYTGAGVSGIEYSGFSITGQIWEINRSRSSIQLASDKPCWAPFGYGRIALWPTHSLLILGVAAVGTPITIDGRKGGFNELAVGQTVSALYSIYSAGYCSARRITAFTSPPQKR